MAGGATPSAGPETPEQERARRRERRARAFGIATALAAMAAAFLAIRWPAPGVSLALGFAVYWLAGGGRRPEPR